MPDKPTDAEIKKALECCKNILPNCPECPIVSEEGCKVGKETLYPYVLDLINRYEEQLATFESRNKALKTERNRLNKKLKELQELVNEMSDYFPSCIGCEGKTEDGVRTDKCVFLIDKTNYCVKRGISNIVAIRKENAELKAENERLYGDIMTYKLRWARATTKLDTAKAEAYKECIEKAKSIVREMVDIMFDDNESKCRIGNCRYTSNVACGNEVCLTENRAFWNSKLDNLLKEMGGEEKQNANTCISCGSIIPEGRWQCPNCENLRR